MTDDTPPVDDRPPAALFVRRVLFPDVYAWFVLLASLDVMLTWLILRLGGSELNAVADWIIRRYDVPGVVVYKFILVLTVVFICEIVGRRSYAQAARLSRWAVVLTAFPVVVASVHLVRAALAAVP